MVIGDVTDKAAIAAAVVHGVDTVVLGSAITAGTAREAADPESILQVNLMALAPILRAARSAGVRRIINLSSAAVYGRAALGVAMVDENTPPAPGGLYAITKFSSEMTGARLAELWGLDFVSVRLSAVFGPWERETGVRDTTSAPFQIAEAARLGVPALLSRPGVRDWIYAPDVARAVLAVAQAQTLQHRLYNISASERWSALAWGEYLASIRPGFACRLAEPGETPNINLHSDADRAPLSVERIRAELGWKADVGLAESVTRLEAWPQQIASSRKEVA
jgi:UDP-glucose 4-epimerase